MKARILNPTKKQMNIIMILSATVIITVISIMLALLGSNIYKNSAEYKSADSLYSASMYFQKQIRNCTNPADIRTAYLGGSIPALVISTNHDKGHNTETWFFAYEGNLCKRTAQAGESVSENSGQAVMALKAADFHMIKDDLLEITIVNPVGDSATVNIQLTGKGGSTNE